MDNGQVVIVRRLLPDPLRSLDFERRQRAADPISGCHIERIGRRGVRDRDRAGVRPQIIFPENRRPGAFVEAVRGGQARLDVLLEGRPHDAHPRRQSTCGTLRFAFPLKPVDHDVGERAGRRSHREPRRREESVEQRFLLVDARKPDAEGPDVDLVIGDLVAAGVDEIVVIARPHGLAQLVLDVRQSQARCAAHVHRREVGGDEHVGRPWSLSLLEEKTVAREEHEQFLGLGGAGDGESLQGLADGLRGPAVRRPRHPVVAADKEALRLFGRRDGMRRPEPVAELRRTLQRARKLLLERRKGVRILLDRDDQRTSWHVVSPEGLLRLRAINQ